MPHLSKPQAVVLAMWSFGIAITQCCGLTTVSAFLSQLLDQPENTVRQRLKDWYKGSHDKWGGKKRTQIEVSLSFAPLVKWIIGGWTPDQRQLVLAVDASTLSDRFSLLVISLVYRGCGIPVAWKVLEATTKGSWKPHWLALFGHLKGAIPEDWQVIVTADRGLYAKWMYEAITDLHWHPFLRINHHQGEYQPHSDQKFLPLSSVVLQCGDAWSGRVTCFKTNPLSCTLLGRWDAGYQDPWLVVTDLDPQQAEILWYGMRSWIECLFKDIKRGGLNWQLTRMDDPERVERLWLAIAVATLWLVSVGGQADAQLPECSLPVSSLSEHSPDTHHPPLNTLREPEDIATSIPSQTSSKRSGRLLSCFRRGFIVILATLIKGEPLPTGSFFPDYESQILLTPYWNSV